MFLKERTPKPTAISQPTPKAVAPIDEQKVNQIKMEYSPVVAEQPSMESDYSMESTYSRTPSGDSYIPTSDLIDVEKIKKQAEVLQPTDISMEDMLSHLTPLAVEAIFGQGQAGGVSAGIAGSSLLGDIDARKKRKQSLEDKLMELKKLSGTKADTEAGKQARFEASQKQRQSMDDRRIILQTRDKLNQDKEFQRSKARYNSTNDAINVLNQRNPIGDAGVQILFAKGIFGETGPLTDQEQKKFIGSPALIDVYNRLLTKYDKGILGESDRGLLLELAVHMRERAKLDQSRISEGYISGIKSLGIDPTGVISPLLKTSDVAADFRTADENLVERNTKDGPALFDKKTKKFVRWK